MTVRLDNSLTKNTGDNRYLKLDQTTPQTILNDTFKLDVLKSKSILGTDADGKIIEGTHQDISGKENSLGNPSVNDYVLSSKTDGTRSWVEMSGGGGSQTPWTSDIDGAKYDLNNVTDIFSHSITGDGAIVVTGAWYPGTYDYAGEFLGKPYYYESGGNWYIHWSEDNNKWVQHTPLEEVPTGDIDLYVNSDYLIGEWTGGIGAISPAYMNYSWSISDEGNSVFQSVATNKVITNELWSEESTDVSRRWAWHGVGTALEFRTKGDYPINFHANNSVDPDVSIKTNGYLDVLTGITIGGIDPEWLSSLSSTTDNLPEGSTNLYFTDTNADNWFINQTTDNLTEGSTNLYFTDTNADAWFVNQTTDGLTEGSTNLYYSDTYVDTWFGNQTTDGLAEGSTNLYFTDTNADNWFGTKTTDELTEGSTNLYASDTNLDNWFGTKTTDELAEGSTNLYFNDTNADNWLANKGGYTGDLNDSTSTKIADVVDGLITSVVF